MNHMGRNDGVRSHWDTFFYPKDRLWLPITTSPTYYRNKWSLSFTAKMWMKQQTRENCSPAIATWRWSKTGHQHTQPRPPTRGAKKNLPNFIEKPCWPPNFPDINPVENLWSIMDEVVYKDPTPKTKKDLKRWLKQAWKKIPLSTPHDLSHSMPQRLRNVITNKGGHDGYWLSKYMCSVKQ